MVAGGVIKYRSNIYRFVAFTVLIISLLLAAGCGGGLDKTGQSSSGGTDDNDSRNDGELSERPSVVRLVEASSASPDSLTLSWFPATDDTTPQNKIVYTVYASESENFTPSPATKVTEVTGQSTIEVDGLQAGKRYYTIVTATDADGQASESNRLEGKVVAQSATRSVNTVHTVSTATNLLARSTSGANLPTSVGVAKVGDILISGDGSGALTKVVSLTAAKGGASTVVTESASLNEVFTDIDFNTRVKLYDLPSSTSAGTGVLAKRAGLNQGGELKWESSGLTLTEANDTEATQTLRKDSDPSDLSVINGEQTDEGTNFRLSAPAYASVTAGQSFSMDINATVFKDISSSKQSELCDIQLASFKHPDSSLNALTNKPQKTLTITNNALGKKWNGRLTLDWTPTEQQVDPLGKPYVALIRAYLDVQGQGCNGGGWSGVWAERLDLEIPVYVISSDPSNTPDDTVTDKVLTFSGGFNVEDKISYDIKPELIIGASIRNTTLQTAEIKAKADLSFKNVLTITATGEAKLNKLVTVLPKKKFIKVFTVGGVPVVVSGAFKIDATIVGNVTGEAALEKLLELRFPETTFGLEYKAGSGWNVVKNFVPEYTFEISGEANAHADLTLTLIPDMQISFYDAASGHMLVEPYLYADTDLHGQFKYLDESSHYLTDLDYWFDGLEAGGGTNLKLYAGLKILDVNLISYPSGVDLGDIDKYASFKPIDKTPFFKLPTLTTRIDDEQVFADSRSMLIVGEAENYALTLLGSKFTLNPFVRWTEAKLVTLENALEENASLEPVNIQDLSRHEFKYTQPGEYTIRLGGYSKIGQFVRQVAPITISLTDNDNDGMVDQWEEKYGVFSPGGDKDRDGVTNLEEFKAGTFPNDDLAKVDSDGDGMSDWWETLNGFDPNDPSDGAKDSDGDGVSNQEEFANNSDPNSFPVGFSRVFEPYQVTDSNGNKTTISTYNPSGSIYGNVELKSGTLDLQGQTLIIYGHLIHSGGVLNVNGGHLEVKGDYRIQTKTNTGYSYSSGILDMRDGSDRVVIGGDFVTDSTNSHQGYLTAGTLTVRGSFTQQSTYTSTTNPRYNFHAAGSHRVVLAGNGKQVVRFEDVSGDSYSHFSELEVKNTSGLLDMPEITAYKLIYAGDVLKLNTFTVQRMNFALTNDMTISLASGNAVEVKAQTLDLAGHSLSVVGDMTVSGNVTASGGQLSVAGSLTHSAGVMALTGGRLTVGGDYRIQTKTNTGYSYSSGILDMRDGSDRVVIGGDFVTDSTNSHQGYLTAGTLTVRGSFTQQSTYTSTTNPRYNFHAAGSHRVVLAGNGKQVVSFEDVAGDSYSHFNQLVITNNSVMGVDFNTSIVISNLFEHRRNSFTLYSDLETNFPDYDGDGVRDHLDPYPQNAAIASLDSDGDGILDNEDAFPDDKTEWKDSDGDGVGNNQDTDDDNDGMSDAWELANGLNPLDASDATLDTDGDNVINLDEYRASTDPQLQDSDGDGINDDLDQVVGSGLWGYACNVVNDPNSSTRRWGINQYNLADLPNATGTPVYSMSKNRTIQSVACAPSGESVLFSMKDAIRGDYEIYELETASGFVTQITDNDTDDADVTRSRDGRTVAWQMRLADGRQALELRQYQDNGEFTSITLASANPFVQPSLSPNGKWLTFVQLRPSSFAVMRYDIVNGKYKEVRVIARRKKLYHPSITDDGNKIGWSERTSMLRYRVKDLAEDTTTDVVYNVNGVEHAVLSGDGKHVIYSVNTAGHAETYLTALETLETTVIGETLNSPVRYLSNNWLGSLGSNGFALNQVSGRYLRSVNQSMTLWLKNNGSGVRYPLGSDDAVAFNWQLDNGVLTLTEQGGTSVSVIRLLAATGNQFTVSMISPDGQGGVVRSIDTFNID